jgi:hypothetical protein
MDENIWTLIKKDRRRQRKFLIILGFIFLFVLIIIGVVLAIVLTSKHETSDSTTTSTTTTVAPPPSTIELTILISLCVGEKQPQRYKRSDYAENINTTNEILQGVVENLKDDINSGKLAIIFEPFNDRFLDATDKYYEYDTIKNEINNLTSYQTTFNGNPNQTSNMERILNNIKQTRRKRDTTNKNKSNQLFHFTPPRNFYPNNESMYEDINQARNIIKEIMGNNEPVTVFGLDLDETELNKYGNITLGFFKNSNFEDVIKNITNFINITIYSLQPTTTTAVHQTTIKPEITTTKSTETTSTQTVTKPSTTPSTKATTSKISTTSKSTAKASNTSNTNTASTFVSTEFTTEMPSTINTASSETSTETTSFLPTTESNTASTFVSTEFTTEMPSTKNTASSQTSTETTSRTPRERPMSSSPATASVTGWHCSTKSMPRGLKVQADGARPRRSTNWVLSETPSLRHV